MKEETEKRMLKLLEEIRDEVKIVRQLYESTLVVTERGKSNSRVKTE